MAPGPRASASRLQPLHFGNMIRFLFARLDKAHGPELGESAVEQDEPGTFVDSRLTFPSNHRVERGPEVRDIDQSPRLEVEMVQDRSGRQS